MLGAGGHDVERANGIEKTRSARAETNVGGAAGELHAIDPVDIAGDVERIAIQRQADGLDEGCELSDDARLSINAAHGAIASVADVQVAVAVHGDATRSVELGEGRRAVIASVT